MPETTHGSEPHESEGALAHIAAGDNAPIRDLTSEQRERLRRSLEVMLKGLMAKVEIPEPPMPSDLQRLKVDVAALLPAISALADNVVSLMTPALETFADSLRPVLDQFFEQWREQFAEVAKNIAKIAEVAFPPNWHGDGLRIPDNIEELLLDEGLPLAWVPPRQVLDKVFAAESAGERRRILSYNWRTIATACLQELERIKEPELTEYAEFAMEAGEVLLAGRWRASQALSTNLLDSILHLSFDKKSRNALTNQRQRLDWDTYPIRYALVVGGVWGSYGEYWPSKGDPIPRKYTRHASAHGVSRRQYTRLNSLIALMHVVGVLKMMESESLNGRR